MRRDMQEVLERWGRWAAHDENCASVDWPAMSVIPMRSAFSSSGPSCSDADGLLVDRCVAKLKTSRGREDMLVLGLRFVGGLPLRNIALALGGYTNQVRRSLNASEAFLEGGMVAGSASLDMDSEVSR
ncbi:antiterminator Q family protein [Serratia symbiotica]|uniref:Phage antitermination protein Q family protein n=1 Tax=Serratia symbiotica SCt-VLC TaxID=1347341 RepID=A0A068RDF7_9GAMM|nr:Phage antitermination protein Q family protein [Serratia symbiotica SCt-VLC]